VEEIQGIPGTFWADEFDLSALSYPQFLDFFFDRPIVGNEEQYDVFRAGFDGFIASNPATVVAHLQAMCLGFSGLTKVYSHEELNQGLWAVFGAGISCEQHLFDPTVDLGLRIACVESMYLPFRDVVARSAIRKCDSFYWMWWDMILHTFWDKAEGHQIDYSALLKYGKEGLKRFYETLLANGFDYSALSLDLKQVHEAMYQTLLTILALDHTACQWSALHGLGHLRHPLGREVVQSYLDAHRSGLTDEDVRWVEDCRDGKIA
jgi:hypothetical protein